MIHQSAYIVSCKKENFSFTSRQISDFNTTTNSYVNADSTINDDLILPYCTLVQLVIINCSSIHTSFKFTVVTVSCK